MAFVDFMRGTSGRLLRVVAGLGLIVAGLLAVGGAGGVVMAVVGLLPMAAGVFNFCLLGPFVWRQPVGRASRRRLMS